MTRLTEYLLLSAEEIVACIVAIVSLFALFAGMFLVLPFIVAGGIMLYMISTPLSKRTW